MRLSSCSRLRKLESTKAKTLSVGEQKRRLETFVEVETMVRGQPPTEAEIEAERERLSLPQKEPTKQQLQRIAEEVEQFIQRAEND